MERTLLIINSFTNLTKLEHHRNFLEFCKGVNVIPTGLSWKKVPSLFGKASPNFEETWQGILTTAQEQLLTLLMIQYRDSLAKTYGNAYETLQRERRNLSKKN